MMGMAFKSEKNEKLAQSLGISIQSLELRLRRLILQISDRATPAAAQLSTLDLAEANLLGLLNLSAKEMRELKHGLGLVETRKLP